MSSRGFTLIELLLVVALTTGLVAFVIPGFQAFSYRQHLKKEAVAVTDAIRQAQNFALGGVQEGSEFVAKYRFEFLHKSGDPEGVYRGYYLKRLDEDGQELTPVLDTHETQCPVCVSSAVSSIEFSVPAGVVSGFSGSSHAALVCYPGLGEYSVTVDQGGRIYHSEFQSSSCSCDLLSC